jgi:hypothetical protein
VAALVAAATMIVLLLLLLQRGVRRCLSAEGPSAADDSPVFSCTQQRTNSGTRNTTVQQPQDTSVVMNCVNRTASVRAPGATEPCNYVTTPYQLSKMKTD